MPFFPMGVNGVIADKRIQHVYISHWFIVKQNAVRMLNVLVLTSGDQHLTVDCGHLLGICGHLK